MDVSEVPTMRQHRGRARGFIRAVTIATATALSAAPAAATTIQFAATIDGAQETPPTATGAMASGTFVMDTDANTLSVNVVITVPPPSGEAAAHIHGFAGPGVPAGILFGLPLGSPKIAVWNFAESDQPQIIAGQTYVNIHSSDFLGGEIRGQILRVPTCGDGFLDPPEECDDGNNVNGDCCSALCESDAAGSPCTESGLCPGTVCDGAGECVSVPQSGCKSALKSILLMKDDANPAKDKLLFKWLKGDQTDLAELGMPTGTTSYALCIYAGTTAFARADIAPGSGWSAAGTTGFKFKDKTGANDGITKVVLKSGAAGKTKAIVKGKGANLPDPTLGSLTLPVTAQLVNSAGTCVEGVFDASDVITDSSTQFKAKAQ